jgi:LysR family nitrogen assimilation transcriptional regulator
LLKTDQKISFKALAELPLILPNYPHKMRSLMESAAARARVKLKIAHQIEGVSFILELVDEGFGCTMLARHLVQESSQPHRFQLNHIGGSRLERSLCMAVSSHRKTSPLMQETLHLMTQFIDEDRIADT